MAAIGHAAKEAVDRCYIAMETAFACSQSAWDRGDEAAHTRAAKLFKKYRHRWEQAKARAAIIDTRVQEEK